MPHHNTPMAAKNPQQQNRCQPACWPRQRVPILFVSGHAIILLSNAESRWGF